MKREIKFRGWDIKRNEWVYGYFYTFGDRAFIIEPGKPGIPEQHIEVDSTSIGQFTGLHDNNGKEIYEGDILQYYFHDLDVATDHNGPYLESGRVEVIYSEWCMAFRLSCTRFVDEGYMGADEFELWDDKNLWTVEVIGNVWENPELIKNPEL